MKHSDSIVEITKAMQPESNLPESNLPAKQENKEIKERPFENEVDMAEMLKTAGKVELTEAQKKILFASVNEEDIEIRPDGLIYMPWMEYARRLSETFGMEWALIPQGMPKYINTKNSMIWGFWLIIKGSLCGYAIGEQDYYAESKYGKDFMSYTDACEGAKSNALMRLCKGIGISLELWKPSFIRKWKEIHAEKYYDEKKGKYFWRLKNEKNKTDEEESGGESSKSKTTKHMLTLEEAYKKCKKSLDELLDNGIIDRKTYAKEMLDLDDVKDNPEMLLNIFNANAKQYKAWEKKQAKTAVEQEINNDFGKVIHKEVKDLQKDIF